ncbi:MAG: TolC family protein [Bacteroidota bacterium]
MKRIIKFTLLLIGCYFSLQAQNSRVISLDECKEIAKKNNITLQRSAINIQNAHLNTKLQKRSRLPSASASANTGIQFGRTINPSENTFINQDIGALSFSVSAGVPVYNGGSINNNIQKAELQKEVATLEQVELVNSIILEVARVYYDILQFEEQLQIAQTQLEQTQQQLELTDVQIEAGRLPRNERLSILVNQSTNEQQIIEFENALEIAYTELRFLLRLDMSSPIELAQVAIEEAMAAATIQSANSVYERAVQFSPRLSILQQNQAINELDAKILKADGLPSVDFFGSASSNFAEILQVNQSIGVPFFDQIDQNFGQSIGLSIRVPIFLQGRLRLGLEQFRIAQIGLNIDYQEAAQNLQLDVNRSLNRLKLAEQTLTIAERRTEQATASYDNAVVLFENGAINTLDLTNFQNLQQQAASELVRAKYAYLYQLEELKSFVERL